MANLLYDLRDKIEEIVGESVSDLWLDIAWDMLVSALGYDPSYGEATDEWTGTGDNVLYLIKRPVEVLLEVIINEDIKELEDFKIYKKLGVKYLKGKYRQGVNRYPSSNYECGYGALSNVYCDDSIEVTYEGGYTDTNFPNDLLFLVCDLIKYMQKTTDGSGNLSSYSISDISYKFLSYDEKSSYYNDILDKYRSL